MLGRVRNSLLVGLGLATSGIGLVWLLSGAVSTPLSYFTRDPVEALGRGQPYVGLLSHLGIMLWAAAATSCFIGFARGRDRFLLWFGILTVLLAFDDAFLFHERVLPNFVGIPQDVVNMGWVVLVGGSVLVFARRILSTDYLLFALALGGLALSAGMDAFLEFSDLETFLEDAAKFVGIVFWAVYFFHTARNVKPS